MSLGRPPPLPPCTPGPHGTVWGPSVTAPRALARGRLVSWHVTDPRTEGPLSGASSRRTALGLGLLTSHVVCHPPQEKQLCTCSVSSGVSSRKAHSLSLHGGGVALHCPPVLGSPAPGLLGVCPEVGLGSCACPAAGPPTADPPVSDFLSLGRRYSGLLKPVTQVAHILSLGVVKEFRSTG